MPRHSAVHRRLRRLGRYRQSWRFPDHARECCGDPLDPGRVKRKQAESSPMPGAQAAPAPTGAL